MAKMVTPEMQKINKRLARERRGERAGKPASPGREAWLRLKRNKLAIVGMIILILLVFVAIFADVLAPYSYTEQNYDAVLLTPCAEHPFGTDSYGRDILSRVIYGTRVSFPIGFICVFFAYAIGGFFGAIAAYYGGKVDMVIMRIVDILSSIPNLVLLSLIALVLDHYLAKGAQRCYSCIPVFALITFSRLPWIAGYVDVNGMLKLAIAGAAVFTAVTWLFTTMCDRLSSGPACKAAPLISALGLYLAAQCLTNILL